MRPISYLTLPIACVFLFCLLPYCNSAPKNAAPPNFVLKCPPLPASILADKALAKPMDKVMLYTALPHKVDYSQYITLTRCQDGFGGCFMYAALSVIDIIKEREHPYTPDLSYRYAQYYYDTRKVPQKEVHTDYGSCSEANLHSDYDGLVWVGDHFDESNCPSPTSTNDQEARRYRIKAASDPIMPAVNDVKSLLFTKGPLWASGKIEGVDHCIAVVGYDDDQQAFKFINSWGDTWNSDGYGWIPYTKLSQTLDTVRYYTNEPSERAGTPYAYTARIRIRHDFRRSEMTVKIGLVGQTPMVVWDRPNDTGPIPDYCRNLDIDMPLPIYAATHWAPKPGNTWCVEVTDGTMNGKTAVVEEVTLARLIKNPNGTYMTEVRRPSRSKFDVPDGGTRKVYIGAPPPDTTLLLEADPPSVNPGAGVTLKGALTVTFNDSDGNNIVPLAGKEIKINRITSTDSIEQSSWVFVGKATTNSAGKFSLNVTPSETTTYVATYTKPDGQIIARSDCRVGVGKVGVPVRMPTRPSIQRIPPK